MVMTQERQQGMGTSDHKNLTGNIHRLAGMISNGIWD